MVDIFVLWLMIKAKWERMIALEKTELDALARELIALRRDLHAHPETAWTEYRTTAKLISHLEKAGIATRYGAQIHGTRAQLPDAQTDAQCLSRAERDGADPAILARLAGGYTGLVAELRGARPGPTIVLRVDIDALAVQEDDSDAHVPARDGYASRYPGQMHACGHDAHAAIGLGAALLLQARQSELCGTVRILFQPAEEIMRGAASLIEAGLVDDADYFFGGHVGLQLFQTGAIAAGCTGLLASTKFNVRFHGRSAHSGASPQLGCNAVAAAANATLNLLAIPRHGDGTSRVNVGTFHGGSARNVVPAEAELACETRGLTSQIDAYMEESADRVCRAAAEMYGCEYEREVVLRAESAESDADLADFTARVAQTLPGVVRVERTAYFGACEDVTLMMRRVAQHGGRATELLFGTPIAAPHHNGQFDIDEAVIPLAARTLAELALRTAAERP